jgi:carbamoyl-phosphate synthase large subunit
MTGESTMSSAADPTTSIVRFMHLAAGAALLPRLTDREFESALLKVIVEHQIGLVIPTIDTELPVLAAMRAAIEAAGARLLISGEQTISLAGDKFLTERFLSTHEIPHPHQWSADEAPELAPYLSYPVFIKPRGGSASIGVVLAQHEQQLRAHLGPEDIVQEVASGDEFTVDVWVDESGELRSCIARRRLAVRGGEVEKGGDGTARGSARRRRRCRSQPSRRVRPAEHPGLRR